MSWMDGWSERSEPPAAGWVKGQRRKVVAVLCCEDCGATGMSRETKHVSAQRVRVQYWRCASCQHLQKEVETVGKCRAVVV